MYIHILYIYIHTYNSLAENSLIFIWLMLGLQRNLIVYYTVLKHQVLFIKG